MGARARYPTPWFLARSIESGASPTPTRCHCPERPHSLTVSCQSTTYLHAMGGDLELRAVVPYGQAAVVTLAELLDPADAGTSSTSRVGEVG